MYLQDIERCPSSTGQRHIFRMSNISCPIFIVYSLSIYGQDFLDLCFHTKKLYLQNFVILSKTKNFLKKN